MYVYLSYCRVKSVFVEALIIWQEIIDNYQNETQNKICTIYKSATNTNTVILNVYVCKRSTLWYSFTLTASILMRTSQEENIFFSISCFHQTPDVWWRPRNPHRVPESGLRLGSGPGSRPPLDTWLRLRHRLRHTSGAPETRGQCQQTHTLWQCAETGSCCDAVT